MSDGTYIEGRNVALRPVRTEEQEQLIIRTTNEEPYNHFVTRTPFSEAELEARLEDESVMLFTVHDGDDGSGVGFIMSKLQERDARAELGVAIREADRGNEHGTRAVMELTDYLFKRFPIEKVFGRRFEFNDSSRKVIEKCDFTEEGTIPDHRYSCGELQGIVIAALYRDEWERSPVYSEAASEPATGAGITQ